MSSFQLKNHTKYIDPIFSITQRFNQDNSQNKVNLGVGVYYDENGSPYVLKIVKKVELEMAQDDTRKKTYLPITGHNKFVSSSLDLIYGADCSDISNGLVNAVQTLSGTGAVRLAIELLHTYYDPPVFYCPNITWALHPAILKQVVVKNVESYKYYDRGTFSVCIQDMIKTFNEAPERSVVILQGCCHNPSGTDLNKEQWARIGEVILKRKLIPIIDIAYCGLATGSFEEDVYGIRLFREMKIETLSCFSYSKNFGIYNERAGILAFNTCSSESTSIIVDCLSVIIRHSYSTPPNHGAEIVSRVLGNREYREIWQSEVRDMSERIKKMRTGLYERLSSLFPSYDWSFIIGQKGFFCLMNLNEKQINYLEKECSIYMIKNGRINISGLTEKNIDYVAISISNAMRLPD